jgi:hypothetical protein
LASTIAAVQAGKDVGLAVKEVVQDGQGKFGHADFIEVGVGKGNPDGSPVPVLYDTIPLATGIASWFCNLA